MNANNTFAMALIGLSLIAIEPSARSAESEDHLAAAADLRAAALAEERRRPVAAERFERLWNKSSWLVGCGAGFGRSPTMIPRLDSPHLLPEDALQRADDDTRRLIEWAQLQDLRDWYELSVAGSWITAPGGYGETVKSANVNLTSCGRTADELHAGVLALPPMLL
jgi:hypothetical protein